MIKNKLKSRRGASITFALFVFLICAVASAVVIVAATASAGRMSNLPEMDQRYYAVNSAAELLRTVIENNPTVTAVKTTENTDGDAVSNESAPAGSPDLSPLPDGYAVYVTKNAVLNKVLNPDNYSLLTSAVSKLLKKENLNKDEKLGMLTAEVAGTDTNTAAGIQSDALEAAQVDIWEKVDSNGTLTFYISKKEDRPPVSGNPGEYTLRMIFEADIRENKETHVTYGEQYAQGDNVKTRATTTTTTTTTYTWHLTNVVKSKAPRS